MGVILSLFTDVSVYAEDTQKDLDDFITWVKLHAEGSCDPKVYIASFLIYVAVSCWFVSECCSKLPIGYRLAGRAVNEKGEMIAINSCRKVLQKKSGFLEVWMMN